MTSVRELRSIYNGLPIISLLDHQFTAEAISQRRSADFTYIWTAEGSLYVAVFIDLTPGDWSMNDSMPAQFVTDASEMAIWRHGKPEALLHQSEQGSQYNSEKFQRSMPHNAVTCSTSRLGNVWENAAMENFFSLKAERIGRKNPPHAQPRKGRPIRLHLALLQCEATLGYLQPHGLREAGAGSVTRWPRNRQQPGHQ